MIITKCLQIQSACYKQIDYFDVISKITLYLLYILLTICLLIG